MPAHKQTQLNVVGDVERASALLNPLRLQILNSLREPNSASGLARVLALPRQKINYHLRELEKNGLVEQVDERKKGNCVERIVRATARYYLIHPETLGALGAGAEETKDRFSSTYLIAAAARALRDVAELRAGADRAGKKLPTFTLEADIRFASPAALTAFCDEVADAVAHLASKYHDDEAENGRRFHFLIGSYPSPSKARRPKDAQQT